MSGSDGGAETGFRGGPAPAGSTGGPAVKICGLGRRRDVEVAVGAGADYVGLVFAESPRRVTPARASELVDGTSAYAVGVFVDAAPVEVLRAAESVPLDVVQLHGSESPELCAAIRSAGMRVWKALRPTGPDVLADGVDRYRDHVDGLLVEGHSEEAAGGTGTAFPHEWWREAGLDRDSGGEGPWLILAGGLTPGNVGRALSRTAPDVVDVSSGVESEPGTKDPDLIRAFVRAVRRAREPDVATDESEGDAT